MPAKNKSNEIRIVRVYDAPVKLVWEAWVDPKRAAKWWGPRGFTITTHSKDLRPGGIWHYTMHGPDGTDYSNKALYHEVEKYSRLVYDHGGYDDRPPLFRVTATFADYGGKTKLDMRMSLPTPEEAEKTRKFIKDAGGNSTWDRLAEYLSTEQGGNEIFVINRSFEAPIETVFEMWNSARHLANWLPPTGFAMEILRGEIKEGGSTFYKMSNGKDLTMYGKIHYREIVRPDRLVYTQQFADKDGNMSRHPLAPIWPETMLTTVCFTEEGPEQTRVTVTWETQGKVSREELAAFVKEKGGMTMGWTGSFDKLDDYLAKQ